MIATYKLNANKLDNQVIESIKSAFYGKEINIVVSEEEINSISADDMINRINKSINDAANDRIVSNEELRLELKEWE